MPAKLTAWVGGGVFIVQGLGKHIPRDWFAKFRRAGWEWHPANRQFTLKAPELSTDTEEEAKKLVDAYNNRFKEAA